MKILGNHSRYENSRVHPSYENIDIAIFQKINIDIDIGNINILLQYIAQQYIDLYPWTNGVLFFILELSGR